MQPLSPVISYLMPVRLPVLLSGCGFFALCGLLGVRAAVGSGTVPGSYPDFSLKIKLFNCFSILYVCFSWNINKNPHKHLQNNKTALIFAEN